MRDFYVGVDLGGTNVRSGLVGAEGEILSTDKRSALVQRGKETAIRQITDSIRRAVEDGGAGIGDLRAIGIGAPGPLDPFSGVLVSPINLPCFREFPIAEHCEKEFGVPVTLDNDANVAALGEHWRGAGRGVDNFLVVTLGTGIGGGAVCEGRLLHGFNGNAAEVGHITVDYNGPRCNCGNYGCLEMYASATGMVRRTRERLAAEHPKTSLSGIEDLTTHDLFLAATDGDAFTRAMFEETGRILGVGLVNAINALNVEVIALYGGLAQAGELIFEPARRIIRERAMVGMKEYVRVVPAELGEDAGLLGAARIAMESAKVR